MTAGWSTVTLVGKTVDRFVPAEPPIGIALYLHGYDNRSLTGSAAYTSALEKHRLLCYAPQGPGCWWTDTLAPSFDPALSPVAWLRGPLQEALRTSHGELASPLAVFGYEMGGQGALQLGYRAARDFPIVAAVAPKVDFETWYGHGTTLDDLFPDRESARQQTATLHLHPLNYPKSQLLVCDPADVYCIDGAVTLASKLASTGILFEQDFVTTHGGYGWAYAEAQSERVIAYLAGCLRDVKTQAT